eukprot:scaffold1162_cov170-Amphora_coffeaeformis.AAC.9
MALIGVWFSHTAHLHFGRRSFTCCQQHVRESVFDSTRRRRLFSTSVGTGGSSSSLETYEDSLKEFESKALHHVTPNAQSIDSLALWLEKGRINLKPKYQRGFVWQEDKASRLVVTALCRRIIPAITLHEVAAGKFDLVDGKQRLSTLLAFFIAGDKPELYEKLVREGTLPKRFDTLCNLDESYESLNGLRYEQLSEERKNAFASFNIPVTKIPTDIPKKDVFSCYEDINSGGEDLTAHQIRRVVFGGDFVDLLDELIHVPEFKRIRDRVALERGEYAECPKESDREMILRAMAFARNAQGYKRPIKSFLNAEVEYVNDLSDGKPRNTEIRNRKEDFLFVIDVWGSVFSENEGPFRAWVRNRTKEGGWDWNTSKKMSTSISQPLFDVMYAVTLELKPRFSKKVMFTKCKDDLVQAMKTLFEKKKLDLSGSVTAKKFVERKDSVKSVLAPILEKANPDNGSRVFSDPNGSLKERLFRKQGGLCNFCGQSLDQNRILDGTYAHIDHIKPHSKGGTTTEENAALLHAECNFSKGAKGTA